MSHAHEANALGALALEVARRVQAAGDAASPHGASVPAALTALHGLTGGQSIDALRRVVGLTHSGAVRLVDRLVAAGLAERRVGVDGRAVALHLTPEGRRAARRVIPAGRPPSRGCSPRSPCPSGPPLPPSTSGCSAH